jgi:hypothetical protein
MTDETKLLPLRLCGYCQTWNRKPCGEQCHLQASDPMEDILANRQPSEEVEQVLREAIWLIEQIGTTGCERTDVIQKAPKCIDHINALLAKKGGGV